MSNNLLTAQGRQEVFTLLYKKAYPTIARYIARRGGCLEEAQDIFQDALVIYYEKATSAPAGFINDEKAFLVGVAKKLWLQQYKLSSKRTQLDELELQTEDQPTLATNKLITYLQTAGKKCMELLKACYYDGFKPDDIAAGFGYSSTHSATVAKYKCLEKVRNTVQQNSLNYADFVE